MFYAVIYALTLNGVTSLLVKPQASLEQCRATAKIMKANRDEQYPDARCVALFFDKE